MGVGVVVDWREGGEGAGGREKGEGRRGKGEGVRERGLYCTPFTRVFHDHTTCLPLADIL